MTRPRIGFIGLGIMGHPMAGHLAKAGFDLTVFDTDAAAVDRLHDVHPGVAIADNPAGVGADSDIVLTMLPDGSVRATGRGRPRRAHRDHGRWVAPARYVVGAAVADLGNGLEACRARHRHGRRPGLRRAVGCRAGQPRLHGRRQPGRGRAGATGARSARPGDLPLWPAGLGSHHEVHQQHHHGDDVPGDVGRARARQARWSRSCGHERCAQRVDRRFVDHPQPRSATHPQPYVRRSVPVSN